MTVNGLVYSNLWKDNNWPYTVDYKCLFQKSTKDCHFMSQLFGGKIAIVPLFSDCEYILQNFHANIMGIWVSPLHWVFLNWTLRERGYWVFFSQKKRDWLIWDVKLLTLNVEESRRLQSGKGSKKSCWDGQTLLLLVDQQSTQAKADITFVFLVADEVNGTEILLLLHENGWRMSSPKIIHVQLI